MGIFSSKLHAYYAPDHSIIRYKPRSRHDGKGEFSFVSGHDGSMHSGEECYLIHNEWLEKWMGFVKTSKGNPGVISNFVLVEQGSMRLKAGLKPKIDFRPINKTVWEYLFTIYGGGPVLLLFVPGGYSEKSYAAGSWVKHVDFYAHDFLRIIVPGPKPLLFDEIDREDLRTPSQSMALEHSKEFANHMLHDLGKEKMRQAKELDSQINQSNAETVAMHMARDLGKQKMAQANKLTGEMNEANVDMISGMFAQEQAKKLMREAKEKEAQQNQAAMDMIANQMASSLAQQKLREAKEAEERATQEKNRDLIASMKRMGAKTRFKEALKAGHMDIAEDAAASMLQGAWRIKLARRAALKQKALKEALKEEAMARKLQCKYRSRLARKKMDALRKEKQHLKEMSCARKLQGAWRAKKARRKVEALRAERQRLREEGCALIVQSSWRIRKAKRRVEKLKAERQRLREEGAALMLQSAWRIKQARSRVGKLRDEKAARLAAEAEAKRLRVLWATSKLSMLLLRLLARLRRRKMISQSPQIILVYLKCAADINVGDNTTSDAYVMVAGMSSGRQGQGATNSTTSMYKSNFISRTLTPVWNEQAMVCGVTGSDSIVLTVIDHDYTTTHDFLGQVVIPLREHMKLFSGQEIELTLPIGDFKFPVVDGSGKIMRLESTVRPGKGTITFSMQMCPFYTSMTGWIMKESHVLGIASGFKKRFMVLAAEFIADYDDEFSLESARHVINADDIDDIADATGKQGQKLLQLRCKTAKDSWMIHFSPADYPVVERQWIEKLKRFAQLKKGSTSTPSSPMLKSNSNVGVGKKSRRTSMFGR